MSARGLKRCDRTGVRCRTLSLCVLMHDRMFMLHSTAFQFPKRSVNFQCQRRGRSCAPAVSIDGSSSSRRTTCAGDSLRGAGRNQRKPYDDPDLFQGGLMGGCRPHEARNSI